MIVAIDATCLGNEFMGTQHVVVETIRALSRSSRIDQDWSRDTTDAAPLREALAWKPPHVHFVDARVDELSSGLRPAIVYRPYQVGIREISTRSAASERGSSSTSST